MERSSRASVGCAGSLMIMLFLVGYHRLSHRFVALLLFVAIQSEMRERVDWEMLDIISEGGF